MKVTNRVTLYCSKKIREGIYDRFRVVVSKDRENDAQKEYKRQGYEVR